MKRYAGLVLVSAALVLGPLSATAQAAPMPGAGGGGQCWPGVSSAAYCASFPEFLQWFLPSISAGI